MFSKRTIEAAADHSYSYDNNKIKNKEVKTDDNDDFLVLRLKTSPQLNG